MAMITYPLNDVMYTAEDAELYNCTRSSGVYSGEDFSCTVSGTNNNVTISEGIGWIRNGRFSGKVFANKAPATLALDIADAANPRIDVIAVRFDAATNSTDFVIKKGEASAIPVMPAMTQTEAVYELYLYSIYRPAAAVAIGADDVTDLRLDESYCGLMADAITSVDTSAINAQFTALLAKIKQELADLKVGKIDAYTKEETLSLTTKTALGLSKDAVPDDAFRRLAQNGENLLDNWYFADPVNQRGQTEYVSTSGWTGVYSIDRWISVQGSYNVELVEFRTHLVGGRMVQHINNVNGLRGKTVTYSVLGKFVNGSISVRGDGVDVFTAHTVVSNDYELLVATGTLSDNLERLEVRVAENTESTTFYPIAAKLELGSTQTLAHKEGDTWVLNDAPPNKQMETLKCCMSKADSADEYANGNNYASLGFNSWEKIAEETYSGTSDRAQSTTKLCDLYALLSSSFSRDYTHLKVKIEASWSSTTANGGTADNLKWNNKLLSEFNSNSGTSFSNVYTYDFYRNVYTTDYQNFVVLYDTSCYCLVDSTPSGSSYFSFCQGYNRTINYNIKLTIWGRK